MTAGITFILFSSVLSFVCSLTLFSFEVACDGREALASSHEQGEGASATCESAFEHFAGFVFDLFACAVSDF